MLGKARSFEVGVMFAGICVGSKLSGPAASSYSSGAQRFSLFQTSAIQRSSFQLPQRADTTVSKLVRDEHKTSQRSDEV